MQCTKIFIIFSLINSMIFADPITPIPLEETDIDIQKAKLGKELFFDKILSKNNTISCANCHKEIHGGADNLRFSTGIDHRKSRTNTPTIYNARYNFMQFYDGRAKNLEEAVGYMIEDHNTMSNDINILADNLNNSAYREKFDKIYQDKAKPIYIKNAIAEYIKTLTTPNSAFDKYLRGNSSALTKSQIRGYNLFKSEGCIICHNGVNLGSNLFARFGDINHAQNDNPGRYKITKDTYDKYFFKVPTLRNISKTAPYMHDGRFYSLRDVVIFMLQYQLDKAAEKKDIDDIVDFLHSLDGEKPKNAQ